MPLKFLSACLLCVAAANAFAASDADFARSLQPAFDMAADNRYKLIEKKAKQTLDVLKTLRDYADDVKKGSEKLRSEMLDNSYEDWVNTKLLPFIFEAKSADETLAKTYDLEKSNVNKDLKTAQGGDYGPIEQTLARVAAFEADYETRVKANDSKINGVRKAYEHHFGLARTALAQFLKLPLVQELLAAKPKLVDKIELVPASLRPLVWRIDFVKERGDYNDPRYGNIPKSVSIIDGLETATYQILIRK